MKSSVDFWEDRYQTGRTGWDRGGPSPALLNWLELGVLEPCRILIPGCGRGYEAIELARRGFDVTAVDFAPSAVDHLRKASAQAGVAVRLIVGDALTWRPEQPFDAVYEQTCLCALKPADWETYAAQLARWLRPGGALFALFMQTGRDGGPPHHCALPRMKELFPETAWTWREPAFGDVPHPAGIYEIPAELIKKR